MVSLLPFLQENFFNVLPRDCNIDFVHIAIAADSFVEPGRTFTVLRTALMHLQKRLACDSAIYSFLGKKNAKKLDTIHNPEFLGAFYKKAIFLKKLLQ